MAKNLNTVSLAFTANTNEAIASIKKLQKELNQLATGASLKNGTISQLTPEIQKAMVAAGELQAKLEHATNLKTGKLDLTAFSESLKKGGVSLQEYANQLNALGPAGRKAFTSLAQSIIQAEAPLIRCSNKLKEFGTTLANTARWQISSSMLHSFMGTIQSAYGYAQDLNSSLNDIRIVTGQSVDQMAAFADRANKAAKALSTTTNEYAKAALIYYQQGDNDADVMKKSDITIKMANVTGQSADTVSDQLTAIWNNFNAASDQSYEHFADVLTALGAATASSTDEIAGGLEKFAAIGDTIGLSYEYAASALATITAKTRQSEDVVGTALKTIFARIQGLNLGDTLDDGTTLNKYSEALEKVGIDIFDTSGQLKDMDNILDEMGAKWKTLAKDQQIALAQTVAGVRQYNQLVSLMDEWDFMESNLELSYNADGTLQEQADIYAESWEAARDRVTASAENIYTKILDDDFFIEFLNGFSKAIDGVGSLIDAFGGLKGVLLTVGAFATRLFHDEITKGLRSAATAMKQLTPFGRAENEKTKSDAVDSLRSLRSQSKGQTQKAENAALDREVSMQEALLRNAKKLSEEDLKQLQIQMDLVRSIDERAVAAAKAADEAAKELQTLQKMNRLHAQLAAKKTAQQDAENAWAKDAMDINFKKKGKSLEERNQIDFIKSQKDAAEAQVRKDQGLAPDADLSGFENEVRRAFVEGIKAAEKEGDPVAKKVAAQFKREVSKKISEAMGDAKKQVESYNKAIESAAAADVAGNRLDKTASKAASDLEKAEGDPEKVKAIQDTLQREIAETIEQAEKLQAAIGKGTDIELDTAISELDGLQKELKEGTVDAERLKDILDQLNATDGGDTLGGTISGIAGVRGLWTEEDGNASGIEGVDFTGHYQAAVEKRRKEVASNDAAGDSSQVFDDFNEKLADKGGVTDWADGVANATNVIMSLGSAITSVQGAIDTFNNPEATAWDKISSVISIVVGLLPIATTLFSTFGTTAAASGAAAGAGMSAALGPVGWVILAVTALIALFIALADAIHKASPQGQFEAASKAAEDAKKAAADVKAEYDNLINTLEGLDEGIKKIEELERGTLEWRQAIIESNNALIELLSTYGMLDAKNFTVDEDGVMRITDEAKETLIKNQTEAMQAANTANYAAQIVKNEKQLSVQASETAGDLTLLRSTGDGGYYDALTENSQLSAAVGEAIGEAMVQGRLDSADLKDANKLTTILSSVTGLYGEEASVLARQIAASDDLVASFNELGASATQTAEANRILGNQIVEANFGDQIKNSGLGEDQQQQVTDMLGKNLTEEAEKIYQDKYKDKWGGMSDKEVQEKYAEAMGWSTDTIENKSGNKAVYYKKDGSQVGIISDEVARRYLAQQEATNNTGENIQDYIQSLEKLVGVGESIQETLVGEGEDNFKGNIGEALGTFAGGNGGDLGSLAGSQLETLQNSISEIKDGQFTIGEGEDAVVVDEAYAKKLGYDTVQEYYDAIQSEIENATNNLDTDKIAEGMGLKDADGNIIKNTAGDAFKELFNTDGLDLDNLTANGKKAFADTYKAIFEEGGLEGIELIDQIVKGAGENASEVAELIGSTDWSSIDSAEEFSDKLKEMGITIDGVDIGSFVDKMKEINNATSDYGLSNFKEEIKNINEVASGLEFGDTISAEDYKKLGEGYEDYFTLMADGSYKLTGDAEAFYNAVMKNSRDKLIESIQADIAATKADTGQYATAQKNLGDTDLNTLRNAQTGYSTEDGTADIVNKQMQLIEDMKGATRDQIAAWQEELASEMGPSAETLKAIGDAANSAADSYNNLGQSILDADENIYNSMQAYLTSATSLADLNASVVELESSLQMSIEGTDLYSDALISLASQYENCSAEIRAYEEALSSGNEELIEAAEKTLKLSVRAGELAKKYDLDAKVLETQAKLLKKNSKELELTEEQAVELAAANQRMNKGIATLNKNWKDWNKTLNTAEDTSMDYAEAMMGLREALVEITGALDDSAIPIEFFDKNTTAGAEHLDWMARAAEGDVQAINLLGNAVAGCTVEAMTFNEEIANLAIGEDMFDTTGFKSAEEAFNSYKSEVIEGVNALQEAIKNGTLQAGQDVAGLMDGTGASWVDSLNQMAIATGMSVEEMNSLLNQLGVQAEVTTMDVPQKMKVPTYTEVVEPNKVSVYDSEGTEHTRFGWKKYTIPGPSQEVDGVVQVAQIKAEGNDGVSSTPKVTWTGTSGSVAGGGVSPSSTSGSKNSGGGGGNKTIQKSNKKTDRYKHIDEKLGDNEREMELAKETIARTYGAEQDQAMQALIDAENAYKENLNTKLTEANDFLTQDTNALIKAAAELQIDFSFDAEGNIEDYEEKMSKLYQDLDQMEEAAMADGNVTEAEEEQIKAFKEKIETLETAITTYDETRETVQGLELELAKLAGMPPLPEATADLIDIYQEVNDQLDDIEDKLDRINGEAERLTGAEKIKKLKEALGVEKEKLATIKKQIEVNKGDVSQRRANLDEMAGRHGFTFNYDENGNITNYDETVGGLEKEYQDLKAQYEADGEVSEAEQSNLDAKKARLDELKGYIDDYNAAVEEGEELVKDSIESFYAQQDINAEILTLTLEFKLEINERDLQRIEYFLSKTEDDFFQAAEAAALMVGNLSDTENLGEGGQLGVYLSNLNDYATQKALLDEKLANEDISKEDYLEGLKTISDGMYENMQNIQALDKAMMHYYEDTLAAAGEEIAKHTERMEHQSATLEHYNSLMNIMGKQNDYKKMGKILEGQSKVLKDQMTAAKATLEFYQGQADEKWAKYQEALSQNNAAAAEMYKKEYEAAIAATEDAEKKFQEKTEAYAESMRAILENKLSELGQDLENALTGGTSFDQLTNALSRAKSLQEEYLTTTNKIYETNKMMRTAQQEIDKSSSSIAKNKLKQFINETEQLQNQNKLSQYELDIQQAKYDLLLAEIALEDAQAAKSTVRLQRDSEGNIGYVYTADENKLAEAEQKLSDAQNKLYNIGLEGANNYTEKYQQTLNEMYSTLTDLQQQYLDGAFESEQEYHDAVTAAKEYYYEKLEQYSSLHAVALTTDSRVIEDAWSSQFSTMVYSTETWKSNVESYVGDVSLAFSTWKSEMSTLEEELGLDDIESAVGDVTGASKDLLAALTDEGGLLDALEEELGDVSDITDAWALQRETVGDLIGDYEELTETIDATIKKMLEVPDEDDDGDDDDDDDGDDDDKKDPPKGPDPPKDPDPPTQPPAPTKPTYDQKTKQGVALAIWNGNYGWGNYPGRRDRLEEKGFNYEEIQKIVNRTNPGPGWEDRYGISNLSQYAYSKFDTGGYTGEWGSEGKFAMLHEKELVLNRDDTANLLEAIRMLQSARIENAERVDPEMLVNLLSQSHGELTSLYEQELVNLNQEMNEIASNAVISTQQGYEELSTACGDSLSKLNNQMASDLTYMKVLHDNISVSYDIQLEELNSKISDDLVEKNSAYNDMVDTYTGQMLSLNDTMLSKFDTYQLEHQKIVNAYQKDIADMSAKASKVIEATMETIKGSYGKMEACGKAMLLDAAQETKKQLLDNNMLDEIVRAIDLQSLNNSLGGGMLNSPTVKEAEKQLLDQKVEITASFPSVSDRNEIEEAFRNLTNQASQYASRGDKKKASKK